jgi:hypothetical protein
MAQFYRVAYSTPVRKGRKVQPSQTRDGESSMYVADVVRRFGYNYGGPLFQFPAVDGEGNPIKPKRRGVETPVLGPDDLLLLNTRPPMDDLVTRDRRPILCSHTAVEVSLFAKEGPLRRWFTRCARSEVVLSDEAASLSRSISERQSMWFRQNGGDALQSFGPLGGDWFYPEKSDVRTVVFLVFAEEAWPGGPKLLATFGMSGTAGLIWARLLATRFTNLLFTTEFAMVELSGPWPDQPGSMAFVDTCKATILGTAPIRKAA